MLHRAALVRTDISEEISASNIRMIKIGELGRTLPVASIRSPILDTLMMEVLSFSVKVGSYKSHTA
jgi:hypothetical protein